jgi:hypothetical protein
LGVKNAVRLPKSLGFDHVRRQIARNAKEMRKIDRIKGESLKKALQPKRDQLAKATKEIYQKEKRAASASMYSDSEIIQGSLGSRNYYSPLAKKTKAVRASYGLESLEFARGDFAIPALKKALRKGIGNAGEPVAISEIGVSGTMIPSLRRRPDNVHRAMSKFWGGKVDPQDAFATMRYNRDWATRTIRDSRANQQETVRRMFMRQRGLSALTPGMIEFAADNRPRNGNGQYIGNETMGVDPNSMQAAYGNVEQEKMMRRRSLVQRMRAMMGRGGNDQVAP